MHIYEPKNNLNKIKISDLDRIKMELTIDFGTFYNAISSFVGEIQILTSQVLQMKYELVTQQVDNKLLAHENGKLKDELHIVRQNSRLSNSVNGDRLAVIEDVLINTTDWRSAPGLDC